MTNHTIISAVQRGCARQIHQTVEKMLEMLLPAITVHVSTSFLKGTALLGHLPFVCTKCTRTQTSEQINSRKRSCKFRKSKCKNKFCNTQHSIFVVAFDIFFFNDSTAWFPSPLPFCLKKKKIYQRKSQLNVYH